jgi:hypothetical protein
MRGILTHPGRPDERKTGRLRRRDDDIDGRWDDLDDPIRRGLESAGPLAGGAVSGGPEDPRRVAVELDGDPFLGRDTHPPDAAVVDARMVQVGTAEDAPQVVEGLERPGLAEDDQIEQPVVLGGRRREWEAKCVPGRLKRKTVVPSSSSSAPGSSTRTRIDGKR